jgi:hypothetical protein
MICYLYQVWIRLAFVSVLPSQIQGNLRTNTESINNEVKDEQMVFDEVMSDHNEYQVFHSGYRPIQQVMPSHQHHLVADPWILTPSEAPICRYHKASKQASKQATSIKERQL